MYKNGYQNKVKLEFRNKEKRNKLKEVIEKEKRSHAMISYDSFLGQILGKSFVTWACIISQRTVAPRISEAHSPYSIVLGRYIGEKFIHPKVWSGLGSNLFFHH